MIKQFYLTVRWDPILPIWVRVDLMAMKGDFIFPKVPVLEPHHLMV